MAGLLSRLRDEVVARLNNQPWAAAYGIEVFARVPGLAGNEVERLGASLRAPFILVTLPLPRELVPGLPVATWRGVQVVVQVAEHRDQNESGVTADEVAMWVTSALHYWVPGFDELKAMRQVADGWRIDEGKEPMIVELEFVCSGTLAGAVEEEFPATELLLFKGGLATDIDGAIEEGNPATDRAVYSAQNFDTLAFTRAAGFFGAAWTGWTAASPWNETQGKFRAGTRVSDRGIVFASHYEIAVGDEVVFVTGANAVVTRELTAKLAIAGTDVTVGILDASPGESVAIVPVVQADVEALAAGDIVGVPVVFLDADEKAHVAEVNRVTGEGLARKVYLRVPLEAARVPWNEAVIAGDSGNPVFLVRDGALAIVSHLTNGGAGAGYWYPGLIDQMNAALLAMGLEETVVVTAWTLDE